MLAGGTLFFYTIKKLAPQGKSANVFELIMNECVMNHVLSYMCNELIIISPIESPV